VLLTEAPRPIERKIYAPKKGEALMTPSGSSNSRKGAQAKEEASAKKSGATTREGETGESLNSQSEAKLADFGLAVSFVSPDIATRRSTLPRYISSLASVFGGGGGSGAGGKEEATVAVAATAAAAAASAAAQPQPQQDKLGDRRVSAVQAQMLRADAGQEMNDAAVARAAGELEMALSKWTGVGAGGGAGEAEAGRASAPTSTAAAGAAAASSSSSSSTPLTSTAAQEKPAPLTSRRVSVSNLLRATNRRVYALTGKTGSYL